MFAVPAEADHAVGHLYDARHTFAATGRYGRPWLRERNLITGVRSLTAGTTCAFV